MPSAPECARKIGRWGRAFNAAALAADAEASDGGGCDAAEPACCGRGVNGGCGVRGGGAAVDRKIAETNADEADRPPVLFPIEVPISLPLRSVTTPLVLLDNGALERNEFEV